MKARSTPLRSWRSALSGQRAKVAILPFLVTCLLASAGIRLVSGPGPALAQEVSALMPTVTSHTASDVLPAVAQCPGDPELEAILTRLNVREAEVIRAEAALSERQSVLVAMEQRISQRLEALKAAEESLTASMARTATAAEDDVSSLVAVYESMKPKDAAPLFEAMSPEFAAGFLIRMRPAAAAAILAGLSPQKAYAISAILAGRNADVPVPAAVAPADG